MRAVVIFGTLAVANIVASFLGLYSVWISTPIGVVLGGCTGLSIVMWKLGSR